MRCSMDAGKWKISNLFDILQYFFQKYYKLLAIYLQISEYTVPRKDWRSTNITIQSFRGTVHLIFANKLLMTFLSFTFIDFLFLSFKILITFCNECLLKLLYLHTDIEQIFTANIS